MNMSRVQSMQSMKSDASEADQLQLRLAAAAGRGANSKESVFREVERLQERERVRKENLKECGNICCFAVFIVIFTVSMLLERSTASSRLADLIRQRLDGGQHAPLAYVTSTEGFMDYLEGGLLPALYENSTDTNLALQLSAYFHPIDTSNRLIGGVRLRQARVARQDNCEVKPMFKAWTVPCYPKFSPSSEDRDPFGPDGMFQHIRDGEGSRYTGKLGTYTSDGYIQVLPVAWASAEERLRTLREHAFFGEFTRAAFVEFALWNANVGIYAVARAVVEFGASGGTAHNIEVMTLAENALKPGGLGTVTDWTALLGITVVVMFVFYYMWEESYEIRKSRLSYCLDLWNVLDWLNMALLLTAFSLRILNFVHASDVNPGVEQLSDPDLYPTKIRALAERAEEVKLQFALCSLVLWAKVTKYLRNVPVVRDLIRTIWDAFPLFLPFIVMFGVAFVGFAMSYNIGFGDKIWGLSTFIGSFTYLGRAFLRDVELMPAYYITPAFGAGLIMLFYVTLLLTGVTVLFAIFADALLRAKIERDLAKQRKGAKEDDTHENEPLEEVYREIASIYRRFVRTTVKKKCPWCYRRFFRKRRPQAVKGKGDATGGAGAQVIGKGDGGGGGGGAGVLDDARQLFEGSEEESSLGYEKYQEPTREELMMAIEHMSGRVLSEVSIVGIEIKSELHDVCERVAQMQLAVDELSARADRVKSEQEAVIH